MSSFQQNHKAYKETESMAHQREKKKKSQQKRPEDLMADLLDKDF